MRGGEGHAVSEGFIAAPLSPISRGAPGGRAQCAARKNSAALPAPLHGSPAPHAETQTRARHVCHERWPQGPSCWAHGRQQRQHWHGASRAPSSTALSESCKVLDLGVYGSLISQFCNLNVYGRSMGLSTSRTGQAAVPACSLAALILLLQLHVLHLFFVPDPLPAQPLAAIASFNSVSDYHGGGGTLGRLGMQLRLPRARVDLDGPAVQRRRRRRRGSAGVWKAAGGGGGRQRRPTDTACPR